jgi:hypothetical protein
MKAPMFRWFTKPAYLARKGRTENGHKKQHSVSHIFTSLSGIDGRPSLLAYTSPAGQIWRSWPVASWGNISYITLVIYYTGPATTTTTTTTTMMQQQH